MSEPSAAPVAPQACNCTTDSLGKTWVWPSCPAHGHIWNPAAHESTTALVELIAQAIEATFADPERRRPVIGPLRTDMANDVQWCALIVRSFAAGGADGEALPHDELLAENERLRADLYAALLRLGEIDPDDVRDADIDWEMNHG